MTRLSVFIIKIATHNGAQMQVKHTATNIHIDIVRTTSIILHRILLMRGTPIAFEVLLAVAVAVAVTAAATILCALDSHRIMIGMDSCE